MLKEGHSFSKNTPEELLIEWIKKVMLSVDMKPD
jgi:hypothetical protein